MSGMVVAHNITSMFSNRQLGITTKDKAKSSERLSSGYRINRAADDAAGLSISEKMRYLIRGLKQGEDNIHDGINMIQTAEGALNEVHDMLHRMNELAIRGLNGTMSHSDRQDCQNEIDELYTEICRVADTTKFNEVYVLQGDPWVWKENRFDAYKEKIDISRKAPNMPSSIVMQESFSQGGADGLGFNQKAESKLTHATIYDGDGNEINKTRNTWSEDLDDNFGTTIDFSQFANKNGLTITETDGDGNPTASTNEFYDELLSLVGTGFYTTCNTCNLQYNIVFTDDSGVYQFVADNAVTGYNEEDGRPIYNKDRNKYTQINVTDLLETASKGTESPVDITKKLVKRIADVGNKQLGDHFTQYGVSSDGLTLGIYDYRDYDDNESYDPDSKYGYTVDPTSDEYKSKGFGKIGNIQGTLYQYGVETYIESENYLAQEGISIQHGDGQEFRSEVHLCDLRSMFDIYFGMGYNSIKDSLTIELHHEGISRALPGETVAKTITVPEAKREVDIYETIPGKVTWPNGEYHKDPDKHVKTGTKTETIPEHSYTIYETLPGGREEQPGYYELNYPILDVIDSLIKQVSGMRSMLGAQQNGLEHSLRYNQNTGENLSQAESRIRDTDMALEMVRYSKESILQQAGQSMLAQANQNNQGVLSLLQ